MNLDIKTRLDTAMEKFQVSQNKAAIDMGYSGAVLSSYRTGTYKGDVQKLEDGIITWIARMEKAHARIRVPIVETDELRMMTNAIATAHEEKDIALIVADAGSGKSTAAQWYIRKNERTTILINVVSGMNKKMLVTEIAKRLSLDTSKIPLNQLIQNVADSLYDRNMVVILDEADYLKADALEFTRRLVFDLGKSGLVLIGLPRLKAMIQNPRDHRQLESRIGVFLPMGGLSKKDASLIAKTVWPSVSHEIIDAIYTIAKTDVRQFTKIIERTQNTMAINKLKEPTLDAVEMAASRVIRRSWR